MAKSEVLTRADDVSEDGDEEILGGPEAELLAAYQCVVTTDRIRSTLNFLGWNIRKFKVNVDNQSTITLAIKRRCGSTKQSRSFRLRSDDMFEMHQTGTLNMEYISGDRNPADGFTKVQSTKMYKAFLKFLYPSTSGEGDNSKDD